MSTIGELIEQDEAKRGTEVVDFRMVTFSLGGREYAFDIMDVKEISKISTITYVPNTAVYVRGVYNLRGEIVSIIDLRLMFHLPAVPPADGAPEEVLFLRAGERVIGVIVDRVDDVVGVSRDRIQPPPQLFGEINIRFIRGVVEHEKRLYVLLDSNMVLGDDIQRAPAEKLEARAEPIPVRPVVEPDADLEESFVRESLEAQSSFYVCGVNQEWFARRFAEWKSERSASDHSIQPQNPEEAAAFLQPFASAHSGAFWRDDYRLGAKDLLPEHSSRAISAWVAGAGEGHEAYSLASIMKERYPEASITIWAHDSDLLKISIAPTLTVDPDSAPPEIAPYLAESSRGHLFSEEIRSTIYFEYHDVRHDNLFPEVDLVVARDLLSFLNEPERTALLADIRAKLSESGVIFIGDHERLPEDEWQPFESRSVRCYRKR